MNPITTPAPLTHAALVAAFTAARLAAQKHATMEDGGTCNFDQPAIWLSKELKFAAIKAAADEAAVYVRDSRWMKLPVAFVGCMSGQGARRTTMAEAACKALNDAGVKASMYYQMD